MKRLSTAVALLVSLTAGMANAVPVTITAEGQVFDSRDDFNLFGLGSGSDTIIGATITQVYTFDTDDIPTTDDASETWAASYRDLTNWLSATTYVDTPSVDSNLGPSIVGTADRFFDALFVIDGDLESSPVEQELVGLHNQDRGRPFEELTQRINFLDFNTTLDIVTSFDPIAAVSLLDLTLWEDASGFVRYSTSEGTSSASFSISSVGVAYASVPEPSTLALLGAGLFGLGFMRKRRC